MCRNSVFLFILWLFSLWTFQNKLLFHYPLILQLWTIRKILCEEIPYFCSFHHLFDNYLFKIYCFSLSFAFTAFCYLALCMNSIFFHVIIFSNIIVVCFFSSFLIRIILSKKICIFIHFVTFSTFLKIYCFSL